MVGVHAGKVADRVAHIELNHADDTPSKAKMKSAFTFKLERWWILKDSLSVLLAAIKGAGGKVLDETDPLSDFHLSSDQLKSQHAHCTGLRLS